ncbi:MAG: hypothetical protein ACR2IC_04560 [Candidatus Methylopumilus sp.]|jgi:hypothetical protein
MSKLVALLVSGLFAVSLNVFAADAPAADAKPAPAAKKEEKKAPAVKPAAETKPAADTKAK